MNNTELEETKNLQLQFKKRGGLVTVQETQTGQLLILASVNQKAFKITLKTRKATL